MGCLGKGLALVLILIMAISSLTLLMVKPASAQSIPTPSVPEFTVKFILNLVNVTTTDPYTGANTTTTQNLSTINLTITNQQYSYSNGSTFGIYYNIRVKGHYSNSWGELYPTTQLLPAQGNYTPNNYQYYEVPYIWAQGIVNSLQFLPQTNSTYTTVSLSAKEVVGEDQYPSNGQVDIQVEAMLGVNSTYYLPSNSFPYGPAGSTYPAIAYVTSSGWSNIETLNFADGSVSITPFTNPTPAPTSALPPTSPTVTQTPTASIPEFSWLAILPLFFSMLFIAVITKLRHRKNR